MVVMSYSAVGAIVSVKIAKADVGSINITSLIDLEGNSYQIRGNWQPQGAQCWTPGGGGTFHYKIQVTDNGTPISPNPMVMPAACNGDFESPVDEGDRDLGGDWPASGQSDAIFSLESGEHEICAVLIHMNNNGQDIGQTEVCWPEIITICDDSDQDGICDEEDNCPNILNSEQEDMDGDGVGDVCDNCPEVANPDQLDENQNGIGDACEETGECILEITKTTDVAQVSPGDEITYNLTLENIGTADCTGEGVKLEDQFNPVNPPYYLNYVSGSPEPDYLYPNYLQWNYGTMEPGDFEEADLTFQVSEETPCETILTNWGRFWSNETDWGDDVRVDTPVVCGTPEPYCGDGIINQSFEECDDGNNISGDGCSDRCQLEEELTGSVCGVKFYDADQNGIMDGEDYNINGWQIKLWERLACREAEEWADEVVSFDQGPNSAGGSVIAERSHPAEALGAAERNDTLNFVSLGIGGEIVFKFDNIIYNGPGDDLEIVETSYGNPSCEGYTEVASVYASHDGINWTNLGRTCLDGTFDIGSLGYAKYVKIVDETDPENFSGTVDGFDIDGVRALNCANKGELRTTETNDDGYCFGDLPAGKYLICENRVPGWSHTTPLCKNIQIEEETQMTMDFGNFIAEVPEASYSISKSLITDEEIHPGDIIEFVLLVKNTGNIDIQQMTITDEFNSEVLKFIEALGSKPSEESTSTLIWYDEFSNTTPLVVGGAWENHLLFQVNEDILESATGDNNMFTDDVLDARGNAVAGAQANATFNVILPVPAPYCGDGIVNQAGEECDDGNNVSGDGCSDICLLESGGPGGGGSGPGAGSGVGSGSQYTPPAPPETPTEPTDNITENENPSEGEVLGVKIENTEEDPGEQAPQEVLGYTTIPDTGGQSASLNYLLLFGLIMLSQGVFVALIQSKKFKN